MALKPHFLCPFTVEQSDVGAVFVVTRRDGTVQRISGPPNVAVTGMPTVFQAAGQDDVQILFGAPPTPVVPQPPVA